jgi:Acetyltransferase (GNAT) domain
MRACSTWHDVKEPTLRPTSAAVGESSLPGQTAASAVDCPDLGSRVLLGHVPRSLTDALPGLYSSVFCLIEYIELFDQPANLNACVLDDPLHVVLFTVHGRDAVILNRLFDIDGIAARRVLDSIFRALPKVRRVRVRHFKLDPADIGLPFRTVSTGDDLVMSLPSSLGEYDRLLGRSTRKNLRKYMNRLSRALPGFTFEVREKAAIDDELVRQVAAFNRVRMRVKGTTSDIDEAYEQSLGMMLAAYGFAGVLQAQEGVIAGCLCTKVGSSYYALVQAFDQAYDELHLGLLCYYLTVCAAVERSGLEYHFLWGNSRYKRQLGGRPISLYDASLYRTGLARALAMSEASQLATRRLAVSTRRMSGRLRHAAGEIRRRVS